MVMKGGVVMVNWLEMVLLGEHVCPGSIGKCQGNKGCEVRRRMIEIEPKM